MESFPETIRVALMPFRLMLAALVAWGGASAAQANPHYFERPLIIPGINSTFVLGDVDGDGLRDFIWLEARRDAIDFAEWNDRVLVMRQLPGGHFDLPRVLYSCHCPLRSLLVFQADRDPGVELAFQSSENYSSSRVEFTFLDPTPPSGVAGVHHQVFGEAALARGGELQALDLDLDGIDELFVIMKSPNFTADHRQQFRLVVFKSDGYLRFRRTEGPDFLRPGDGPFDWNHDPNANRQHVDMDADGLRDVMFDICPQACLYRHDPDGTIRLESVLEQPEGAEPDSVDAQVARSIFADFDEDGIPDRVWWSPGYPWVHLDLQTSKLNFKPVARFPNTTTRGTGKPDVADVDNNGLVDLVYADEAYLISALQREPGLFWLDVVQFAGGGAFPPPGQVYLVDVNGDGCQDVVMLAVHPYYFRGRGCDPPSDLAVDLSAATEHFDVTVHHAGGPRGFPGTVVRVLVAPMSDPASIGASKGLSVTAPPGCTRAPARAPRYLFDCRADLSAAGQSRSWRFGISSHASLGGWQSAHLAAFVLGGPADANPANNHARGQVDFVKRGTQPGTPLPLRPPSKRTAPSSGRIDQKENER